MCEKCIFAYLFLWLAETWQFEYSQVAYVFGFFVHHFQSTKTFMHHKKIEFCLLIDVIKNYLEIKEKMVMKYDFIWFFKSLCRKYQKSSEKKYPEKLSQTLLSLSSPLHACRHTFDLFKTICFEHFDLNTTTGLHVFALDVMRGQQIMLNRTISNSIFELIHERSLFFHNHYFYLHTAKPTKLGHILAINCFPILKLTLNYSIN